MQRGFALIALLAFACISDVPENLDKLRGAEARLRANPHDVQSLDFILGKLDDHRSITRGNAAAILRLLADDPKVRAAIAPRAIPALIEVAQRHGDNESEGITALGEFHEYGAPAVPTLINRLSNKDDSRVRDAAEALGKIGRAATPALPALRRQLRNPYVSARIHTAIAIRTIAPDDREAIDNLIELLQSRDSATRSDAIYALEELGPLALPAVPALEAYDRDDFRIYAREAVESINKKAAVR
ncbi:MAG: HEAT repeat domain-containing protein [Acidobacteriota bacterium]|nr:HEAT repeat domain-containing protein [Acidobacteriota bacterium]